MTSRSQIQVSEAGVGRLHIIIVGVLAFATVQQLAHSFSDLFGADCTVEGPVCGAKTVTLDLPAPQSREGVQTIVGEVVDIVVESFDQAERPLAA